MSDELREGVMTTPTHCSGRCSLHTDKHNHVPCRLCISRHPASREAVAVRTSPGAFPSTASPAAGRNPESLGASRRSARTTGGR